MKVLFKEKSDCCGCSACASICPRHAIKMEKDEEGFEYPYIVPDLCIDCNLCQTVCDLKTPTNFNQFHKSYYGCKTKNETVRAKSQSGGIFSEIANYVLSLNGVIFGVIFENNEVFYSIAQSVEDLEKFHGSKYVQCKPGNAFKLVKDFLNQKRMVLFSGTSCCVAGLKKFLKKEYCNLICIDFVCHGVPSPLILGDFINFYEKKKKDKLVDFNFRDKKFGWKTDLSTLKFTRSECQTSFYSALFHSKLIMRPSCYICQYSSNQKPADFTIGDFWGIDSTFKSFNDKKGTSLLIVHSLFGEKIFNEIKDRILYFPTNYQTLSRFNSQLYKSVEYPSNRWDFWNYYQNHSFAACLKKYAGKNFRTFCKRCLKKFLVIFGIKKEID